MQRLSIDKIVDQSLCQTNNLKLEPTNKDVFKVSHLSVRTPPPPPTRSLSSYLLTIPPQCW